MDSKGRKKRFEAGGGDGMTLGDEEDEQGRKEAAMSSYSEGLLMSTALRESSKHKKSKMIVTKGTLDQDPDRLDICRRE